MECYGKCPSRSGIPTVDPALTIRASWPDASPETVERTVTAPIKELGATVKGVHKISSESTEGKAAIIIEFDPGTQMSFSRLELNELLSIFDESLPAGAEPPVIEAYVPDALQKLQGFISYSLVGPRPSREL